MRLWLLGAVLAVIAISGHFILHETDNLALIEQTAKQSQITLFDTYSFILPESTKITNKDKSTSEFYSKNDVFEAYKSAKKDYIVYRSYEKRIYYELWKSYWSVGILFLAFGGLVGYWLRDPIDKFDFNSLRKETQEELRIAKEEMRKAQETAKNAQKEALQRARAELENDRHQTEYQRQEAEKERRAAIQTKKQAEESVRIANLERDEAVKVADEATRKKNASYAAAERFKRKAEKVSKTLHSSN